MYSDSFPRKKLRGRYRQHIRPQKNGPVYTPSYPKLVFPKFVQGRSYSQALHWGNYIVLL